MIESFKQYRVTLPYREILMDISPRLSGDEWQAWVDKLLQRHYGPSGYQKVPDHDRGDAGIEGFTLGGIAYQAYGPVEPLTTAERYEKHRTKMTTDINKFIKNAVLLSSIFGNIKICRWVLLVPYYDSKEIVRHAANKTQDVLDAGLPYVSSDFRVVVEDENAFAVERDQLIDSRNTVVNISWDETSSLKIGEWVDENDTLVKTIEGKIGKLQHLKSEPERQEFRNAIIKAYLDGQNALDELRKYPIPYESIRQAKSQKERYLYLETRSFSSTSSEILEKSFDDLRNTIHNQARGISPAVINSVIWEAIADWIIRCPLDFPDKD